MITATESEISPSLTALSADSYDEDYDSQCAANGRFYKHEEIVLRSNPCQKCFCNSGTVVCADRVCLTPKGYEDCIPLPTTECCPEQFECSK